MDRLGRTEGAATVLLFLTVWILAALASPAEALTIVVNRGAYESAEVGAHDEANVGWNDANPADDTICTECFAAAELQHYLRMMTSTRGGGEAFLRPSASEPEFAAIADDDTTPQGNLILIGGPASNALTAKWEDVLGVHEAQLDSLGPEGYIIRTRDIGDRQVTVIAGGGRVGTLYGVYDLLHRLGVRWYAPGEDNEEVPRCTLTRLPEFEVRERPAFLTRGFHAWENRASTEFLLWMARNRLNYWCVEQEPKPLLHKLGIMLVGGGHVLTSLYLGPQLSYPYDHPRFAGDEAKPQDPYPVSPQYQGDANGDGTLSYFEAHPEWYGLRGGKRSANIVGDGGDNFCTSNPDAMAEWMKNAIADLATGRYKDADIINAWTLDGGRWCECQSCKALGSPTDRNILFVHRYAQEIKRAQEAGRIHRPVRLLFLAYADVLQPPTRPLPADFDYDTCIATYFPIVRCYVHELDDPYCSTNASYNRHLVGWATDPGRHYRGQLCIGEYYNVSGYRCLPLCFMHTMLNDIPYYYELGARHFHYMHCTTGNWGNKALTNWQMARQLWDPQADCGAVWNDYFRGRYGPAYYEMRRFYEDLEDMLCNVSELKYGLARRLARGRGELFTSTHLRYEHAEFPRDDGPDLQDILEFAASCRGIIDGVLRMELPLRVRARVEEDERLFTYGERTVRFYDALCRAYAGTAAGDTDRARQACGEARALAELLRADRTSTQLSSSHASAPDALSASFAAGALANLETMLGPSEPESIPPLDPAQGSLTLTGKDFSGGGAVLFGYGLRVYPEGTEVSSVGNYVYGQGTAPADRMTAWFRLEALPATDLKLSLFGLKCPRPPGGEVSGEVQVNERVLFARKVPFSEREITRQDVVVPREVLKLGPNRITIRNTESEGEVGNRPWFGIDHITLGPP